MTARQESVADCWLFSGRPREEEYDIRVFEGALAPWLGQRPPSGTPITEPTQLRLVTEQSGLDVDRVDRVVCPFDYADEEELLGSVFDSALGRAVGRRAGPVALREAVLERLEPYRTAPGGYRQENVFRCARRAQERLRRPRPEARPERARGEGDGVLQPRPAVSAYRVLRKLLHRSPFDSMPSRVRRARRRCRGTWAAVTGLPSPWMSRAASSPAGRPRAARRRRSRSRSGDAGAATKVSSASSSGPTPASTKGRATRSCPARTAFSRKYLRSSSSSASASPANVATKPACAATPSLISVEAWWSSRTMSARVTSSTADTAS